jgi:hypothetical protein
LTPPNPPAALTINKINTVLCDVLDRGKHQWSCGEVLA